MHPVYDFKSDEWYNLPEAEKIRIREEQSRHKRSRVNDCGTVISEISTGGNGTVQYNNRTIQQRISVIESNVDVQSRATVYIIGGRNEQADLRSINNNHSNDRSVRAVRDKRLNSQVTKNGYDIDELEHGTISVNKLNTNADTCFRGANLAVLQMTSITADVNPYNPS